MSGFQRPRTITQGVYEHLRREVLSGRLAAGQWLREQEIAARLDVSRTPVREAVRQLAQEGLVVIEANRGVRVVDLSADEAVATYEVRKRLEAMAAGLAARRITPDGRRELERFLLDMEAVPGARPDILLQADAAFHACIARLAGNPVLHELIGKLNDRVNRVKIVTRDVNGTRLAREQHRTIFDAVSAGDPRAAEDAMATHIETNLNIIRERLQKETAGT